MLSWRIASFRERYGKNLPQNGISFAHFKGKEITNELIDKKVIVGRIQDIAEQLMVVLKNNMKTPSIISDMKREKNRISYARNPFLVKYMENMRYIDQLGRGIPMIFKNMKALGSKEPFLTEIGEEFILTIYKNPNVFS